MVRIGILAGDILYGQKIFGFKKTISKIA